MPERVKAYITEEWTTDALAIQVVEDEGRHRRIGVVEHLPGDEGPVRLRLVPIRDICEDDGTPRPQAPHPGLRIPAAAAEAVLVALLAWSSSTPGDNPVERAKRAQGERDLALAEVAQLRHDLAVAEEQMARWEVLAIEKDDRICALEDHVRDLGGTVSRQPPEPYLVDFDGVQRMAARSDDGQPGQ